MTIKQWADRLMDNEVKGTAVAMLAEIAELRTELECNEKEFKRIYAVLESHSELTQNALAELAKLKQQAPVGWTGSAWLSEVSRGRNGVFCKESFQGFSIPVYLAAGAQP